MNIAVIISKYYALKQFKRNPEKMSRNALSIINSVYAVVSVMIIRAISVVVVVIITGGRRTFFRTGYQTV
jgi:hypothetical protein